MICPRCRAENSEHALNCSRCGTALASATGAGTFTEDEVTAPARMPTHPKPSTAVGIATPAPGSGGVVSGSSASLSALAAGTLTPGTEFGPRYRIESLLGRGGMGAVYKAYDKDLNRVVALKLVRPELTADASSMQRFKQELLLASKISHKNILRIHDLGDVGGVKFISMAYVEGEDLHHVLGREGRLPLARLLNI